MSFAKKLVPMFFVAASALPCAFAEEAGAASIPDIGVDVTGYITSGIGVIGGVVAAAIGGYVAFLVVKKALKWIGKALS